MSERDCPSTENHRCTNELRRTDQRSGTGDKRMKTADSRKALRVKIDRVQIGSVGALDDRPPPLAGFSIIRDSFVRSQTTISTYARSRCYKSRSNDTKVFWQYRRLKTWLMPWKITLVADDNLGLTRQDIEGVLVHCRSYKFFAIELAFDFAPTAGVNREFVLSHAVFGKSHREKRITNTAQIWH